MSAQAFQRLFWDIPLSHVLDLTVYCTVGFPLFRGSWKVTRFHKGVPGRCWMWTDTFIGATQGSGHHKEEAMEARVEADSLTNTITSTTAALPPNCCYLSKVWCDCLSFPNFRSENHLRESWLKKKKEQRKCRICATHYILPQLVLNKCVRTRYTIINKKLGLSSHGNYNWFKWYCFCNHLV